MTGRDEGKKPDAERDTEHCPSSLTRYPPRERRADEGKQAEQHNGDAFRAGRCIREATGAGTDVGRANKQAERAAEDAD